MNERQIRLDELCTRLQKLERDNRRLKVVGCLLGLIAASLLLMGQGKTPQTIEAERVVLKDANGKVGAELAMDRFGSKLILHDQYGRPVVTLIGSDTPSLGLIRGEKSIGLAISENATTIGLYGKDTGLFHGIRAGVSLIDDVAAFSLYDKSGIEHVTLETDSNGPSITLRDKGLNVIWNAP